ncbi:MAG: hypothetical protein AAF727_07350, partial [Pseudomonadota bacterium]
VQRIITLSGASYVSRAVRALQTPAGRAANLLNIGSRENDVFDFLFEQLIDPPVPGDGAIGDGINLPNVVNIELDCPHTLNALTEFGGYVAPPRRRMCHWSGYTRPGALRFYAHALRNPEQISLGALQRAVPQTAAPRWSRMFAPPKLPMTLPMPQKTTS